MDDTKFASWCRLVPKPTFFNSCIKVHWTKDKCTQMHQREIVAANSSPVGSVGNLPASSFSWRIHDKMQSALSGHGIVRPAPFFTRSYSFRLLIFAASIP